MNDEQLERALKKDLKRLIAEKNAELALKNRELETEAALERVRAVAMSMNRAEDMLDVCKRISQQLELLDVKDIRNVQTAIFYKDHGTYMNYEYYTKHDKAIVTDTDYTNNEKHAEFAQKMQAGIGQSFELCMSGDEVEEWIAYQRTTSVFIDPFLYTALSLNYYWYSLGPVALGITSYKPLKEKDKALFSRFLSVFELAYRRYLDIEQAEAQAEKAIEDFVQIQHEKKRAENALAELKQTQAQLIQSEKMASLGELTAGIAHEIQNPLNFVNNFSEVSNELIDELLGERAKAIGARDEKLEGELLADIKQNLEKINFHGKRADAIVKGMLQHSRKSENKKEPTDINALCDEYIRLSYHGLRAKDKKFNAHFKTMFDESAGKINIVPEDVSRVVLNILNNAFYVVNEKSKSPKTEAGYSPMVLIETKKLASAIQISITDNGNGIPQNIIDKIFQPFFTTKPAGQGTGLGLSLSYDIIRAHGGEIKVETKEGEGTTFTIQLPRG